MESDPAASKVVVITGTSTGIGRACALRMAARGYRVFAGVRRSEDGDSLRREAGNITPVILDVTSGEQVAAAVDTVSKAVGGTGIQALVNNAGICIGGPIEHVTLDALRRQFEVNVFGVFAVTQAFTPLLRAGRGRIVNVSSLAGRVSQPFLGAYSASKHALEGLSDATRMELRPFGIDVCLVEPGSVDTAMSSGVGAETTTRDPQVPASARPIYWDALRRVEKAVKRATHSGSSPDDVADAIEHAIRSPRPRTRYRVGTGARATLLAHWLLTDRAFETVLRGRMGL